MFFSLRVQFSAHALSHSIMLMNTVAMMLKHHMHHSDENACRSINMLFVAESRHVYIKCVHSSREMICLEVQNTSPVLCILTNLVQIEDTQVKHSHNKYFDSILFEILSLFYIFNENNWVT